MIVIWGQICQKISLDIPIVLVSSLKILSTEAAILIQSEGFLPFQGATEQGIENLSLNFSLPMILDYPLIKHLGYLYFHLAS